MIFYHLNSSEGNAELWNEFMEQGKKVFVLFYMEGCGPCNATRPEWKKLENVLGEKYQKKNDIVIADVDQELLNKIKYVPNPPSGFPTMIYLAEKGKISEDYEDSSISIKDRTIDSLVEWIESKISKQTGGSKSKRGTRTKRENKTRKYRKKGGKWSLKYKKSINCRKPKGFSQRQYCKYGKK
jgi:thiol-disulfide isomerase/thioredoxin